MLAVALLAVASPVQAQLCDGSNSLIGADGRAFGHLPYGDAPETELVQVPAEWAVNGCTVRRDMLPDLTRLLATAASDPAVDGRVLALSCHRSLGRQQAVFCREGQTAAVDRAISVAPPGHSEHSTGYALDFAFRPRRNDCPDAEACVAASPAFRWLSSNAPRYGFEMSFPAGNKQGVKWEPWHWRWVGARGTAPGAARARGLFARARRAYRANPEVASDPVLLAAVAPPPVYLGAITPPECRRGKCRMPKVKRTRPARR